MWISESLWRTVSRLDKSKINLPIAFRNSLAVAIPLALGIELGNPLGGVAIATGALNVSYSDGTDPYSQRARRILAWTVLNGVAVFIGSVSGRQIWLSTLAALVWAFVAGLSSAVSSRAGDLGLNTLVTIIVFGARGAMSAKGAALAGLLVMVGGCLQLLFALLLWPIRKYEPERRAIGEVFGRLATEIDPLNKDLDLSPWEPPNTQAQDALQALGWDRSTEGERFRLLFDQASRLRMSAFVLQRMRSALDLTEDDQTISEVLRLASALLSSIAESLVSNQASATQEFLLGQLQAAVGEVHGRASDASSAVDVFAGQLRVVAGLSSRSTTEGADRSALQEAAHPWRLQVSSWIGILKANFDPRSSFFRHAIRLSVSVAIGEVLSHLISWQRAYWLPMTIAVVLRPDFTTTISRGVLRLAGTFTGLILATVLYLVVPATAVTQLVLVGAFTFMLRSIGPANYGVFSAAVGGLIVFLIAATGVPPGEVVTERALNTAAGGLFALIAYAAWPTWERTQVSVAFADMFDASRNYFSAVVRRFGSAPVAPNELDAARSDWRRARSNAEASVDRINSEPRANPENLQLLNSMLASSYALIHSTMALEGVLIRGGEQTAPASFRQFTNDLELTLYFLAAALRGSASAAESLPKLREDHQRMVKAGAEFAPDDQLILLETDQLTVTTNTLREQTVRFAATPTLLSHN